MTRFRLMIVLLFYALIAAGCSTPQQEPTPDINALMTQAFETALAAIPTSTATSVSSPTSPPTLTPTQPRETNTPSPTRTPTPPAYEVGITQCDITSQNQYEGWAFYDCEFWVKSSTRQVITYEEFLWKNEEKMRSLYFYEQEEFLEPVELGKLQVYVCTTDKVRYPVDFVIDPLSELPGDTPIIPGFPIFGRTDNDYFRMHFAIPESMEPEFVEFPKTGGKVTLPPVGSIQVVPQPQVEFADVFEYHVTKGKLEVNFLRFEVGTAFSIIVDVVNLDNTTQVKDTLKFPYYIVDSNGMSYNEKLKEFSISVGPGQHEEYSFSELIGTMPQYFYIVPTNSFKHAAIVDAANPQSSSPVVNNVPVSEDTAISSGFQCGGFASQLQPGIEASVVTEGINMREIADTSAAIMGVIYAGERVLISAEQPVCSGDLLWWKVQAVNSGITGWAVEGSGSERWLVP